MRPGNGAATSGWSSPLASRMLASSACSAPKTCTCYYHDHVAEEGRGMRHASTCCSNMYVAIQYHVAWGMRAPAAATCMWQYNIMWHAAREHLLQQSLLGALP